MRLAKSFFFANGKLAETIYLAKVYDSEVPEDLNLMIFRLKLFEMGHSMAEIDDLSFDDMGLLVGYFAGKQLGDEAEAKRIQNLGGG